MPSRFDRLDSPIGAFPAALAQRLTREHASRRIDLVCAPVFGTPADAAAGRLWVVAAGTDPALARARPILEAFSRGITLAGAEPYQAFALKLDATFYPPQ